MTTRPPRQETKGGESVSPLLIAGGTPRLDAQSCGPAPIGGCPINTAFRDGGYRYRITLRGECGSLVASLFDDVVIESRRGRTYITAAVPDDSGLYGLIDRIQDLALQLVGLRELGLADAGSTAG